MLSRLLAEVGLVVGGMAGWPAGVLGAGRPGIVCGTLLVVSRLRRWALVTFSLGHF